MDSTSILLLTSDFKTASKFEGGDHASNYSTIPVNTRTWNQDMKLKTKYDWDTFNLILQKSRLSAFVSSKCENFEISANEIHTSQDSQPGRKTASPALSPTATYQKILHVFVNGSWDWNPRRLLLYRSLIIIWFWKYMISTVGIVYALFWTWAVRALASL